MKKEQAIEILRAYMEDLEGAEDFFLGRNDGDYDPEDLRDIEEDIEAFRMAIRGLEG